MAAIFTSLLIGMLIGKATDNLAPTPLSTRAWIMIVLIWPVILLVIAIKGRTHEEEDPGC